MKLPVIVSSFLGIASVQKREEAQKRADADFSPEQSSYLSQLSEVQADILTLIPASVFDFYTRTDLSEQDIIDFADEIYTQAWVSSLTEYYTQSKFQELLAHSTDAWYKSLTSYYGNAPLDQFTFIGAVETGAAAIESDVEASVSSESSRSSSGSASASDDAESSSSSGSSSAAANFAMKQASPMFAVAGLFVLALI